MSANFQQYSANVAGLWTTTANGNHCKQRYLICIYSLNCQYCATTITELCKTTANGTIASKDI